ncbi:MAG: peptidoglycan-binding protein [Candidatus Pacebacteria bacterium]|nr:peptidoglycan-binding protein [Candidatus Paceibacterota bacterium]
MKRIFSHTKIVVSVFFLLSFFCAGIFLPTPGLAMSTENYQINNDVLNVGGGYSSSDLYQLEDSIGDPREDIIIGTHSIPATPTPHAPTPTPKPRRIVVRAGGGGGGGGGGRLSIPPSSLLSNVASSGGGGGCGTTTQSGSSPFSRVLQAGSQGADVVALQTFLETKKILVMPAGTSKGFFGGLTKLALTQYQKSIGLPPVGIFGPLTRAQVEKESVYGGSISVAIPCVTPLPSIKLFTRFMVMGDTGDEVKMLQIFLNKHGFPVALSGAGSLGKETTIFDQATKTALMKLQAAHSAEIVVPQNLPGPTGIFGDYSKKYANGVLLKGL